MTRRLILAGIVAVALVAPGAASAKGDVVAFGISGGRIPSEVRVTAGNNDLVYGVEPMRARAATPYRLTLYMMLATDPPEERALWTYELYPPEDGWPAQLRDAENDEWLGLRNEAAARVEAVLATAVPVSAPRGTRKDPAGAAPSVAVAIAAGLLLGVATLARRGAIRSERRLARGGRA